MGDRESGYHRAQTKNVQRKIDAARQTQHVLRRKILNSNKNKKIVSEASVARETMKTRGPPRNALTLATTATES